ARWHEWELPAGRAHMTYRPGPVPAVAAEVTLDSLALGERGFGAVTASVAGTRDSLAWFARSRVGQVGAVLAGGRYTRRADAATAALAGTRAEPQYTGSFSLTNGSIGEFRAPALDGTFDYRDRRLESAVHLWRSGQQVLTVAAHLPLDLALAPVAQRQLPDTLSVRATADTVAPPLLEALTPLLKEVAGVFTADVGIAGTWQAPRLRGGLVIRDAAATIPTL